VAMRFLSFPFLFVGILAAAYAQDFSRGVGEYPGDPKAYAGPSLVPDTTTYRNLALHRPAYHSSSYDYNLTAQLITDGIQESKTPRWVAVATSDQGVLKKNLRECLFDGNWVTGVDLRGRKTWIQVEAGGGEAALELDRIDVDGSIQGPQPDNQAWSYAVFTSDDGNAWHEAGRKDGMARPSGEFKPSIVLKTPVRSRLFRLEFDTARLAHWRISEVTMYNRDVRLEVGGPAYFSSAWMAGSPGEQWVYVDLGADCTFDRVILSWIRRPAEAAIQVAPDAVEWRTLQSVRGAQGLADNLKLSQAAHGRFVRVLTTQGQASGPAILTELEVFGRGGLVAKPKAPETVDSDGHIQLSGGNWRVQRSSQVRAAGETLSKPGFPDADWLVATVPGTVLASYCNAGAVPDPNFGDNQLMISDSFFHSDFWYRNEFTVPPISAGQHLWLNFNGINWKADIFINGSKVGHVDGAFLRGRFDVTKLVRPAKINALAVRVKKTGHPGIVKEKTYETPDTNGGVLGADNPTFQASIGWDWIPTIRGREIGIWNDVTLELTGAVTLENPFVDTILPLPNTNSADLAIAVRLTNHDSRQANGILRGHFGSVKFDVPVSLDGHAGRTISLSPATHPEFRLQNPKLWWPAGYGEPDLYEVQLSFVTDGSTSDKKTLRTGIRQFSYSEEGGSLRIWINGRRFIPRGGSWGFSESMLRYRTREYDAAVRYHRDMNFTMIRNWVGQVGEDEFYEACDRYGIVVWQDFWLANPWDGPDPDDAEMFLRNARDTILRIRNHPSIGLYCGRNEGYPPPSIDAGIRQALVTLHPGIHYIPSSADDVVSGHGPYRAQSPKLYFQQRATPKLHSEMGMPNIVTMDSLRAMMPASAFWPQGNLWGLHDFCLTGAQGGQAYLDQIQKNYGNASSAEDWVALAQFMDYDGYRAMFEAQSRNRMGLLIWMSHPAWPSFVWQAYDYYLEPNAAYFACKKACEPLHIQWNPLTDGVEIVNYSSGNQKELTACAEVLDLSGAVRWQRTAALDSADDSTATPIRIEFPEGLTAVHFVRLKLMRGSQLISENLYWHGLEEGNYRALREMSKAVIEFSVRTERQGDRWMLTTEMLNLSNVPALMLRVEAIRAKSGDRILPAIHSDNYITLMPGEKRALTTEIKHADTRGENPVIKIDGFNAVIAARNPQQIQ
jgi:hypothetical protein